MEVLQELSWQNKIAIANYGVMAIMFALGLFAAVRVLWLNHLSVDARRLCVGIGGVCAWGVMHQSFWFTRWWLYANADARTQWFLDHSWLLAIPYTIAFLGSTSVAYALFRDRCFAHKEAERRGYTWLNGWLVWITMLVGLWIIIFGVLP